ncbi:MAG: hypothetical protein M1833_002021 [Piccolia ochrophora]|nr:MAG: hypothetical protein M1833_002021 [Piccolia ochrophora]
MASLQDSKLAFERSRAILRKAIEMYPSLTAKDDEPRHAEPKPASNFAERFTSKPVDVYVGPEQKKYTLHQTVLCSQSGFFRAAFEGSFREAVEDCIRLPDEDVATFELFIGWLYKGELDGSVTFGKPSKCLIDSTVFGNPGEHFIDWAVGGKLFALYVMADKFGVRRLHNQIMDVFQAAFIPMGRYPRPSAIRTIYDVTAPGATMRRLITDVFAGDICLDQHIFFDRPKYKDYLDDIPDFAADVMGAVRQGVCRQIDLNPTSWTACKFHVHRDGDMCPGRQPVKRKVFVEE